jgi:hypothetical protein
MSELFVAHLERAFILAQQNQSNLTVDLCRADGLSGIKARHFYNNLCSINGVRSLQVGSWSPSIACSALCGNSNNQQILALTCISNFSNCDIRFKLEFESQFNKYKANNYNAKFIDIDYFKIDVTNLGKYNIYVYDGDHSVESHTAALTHFYPVLDDMFIYIVEHWNWESVRTGTFKAIHDLKLNVIWGRDIRLTMDNTHTPIKMAKETWWNGIGGFVLQKTSSTTSSSSIPPEIPVSVIEEPTKTTPETASELDSLLDSITNNDTSILDVIEPVAVSAAPEPVPAPISSKNKKKKKAGK